MRIRRIYLDLDDVCNTLSMHFLHLVGCKISSTEYAEYPVTGPVDLAEVANQLLGGEYFTRPSFWAWFNRQDWAGVPESPQFPWILEQCERLVGRENILIATSPTKDGACAAGKVDWIRTHCPEWMHRNYAITPRKWFFGHDPHALLVDDNQDNCRLFRKCGGRALLVPRPWNRLHACDTSLYLVEQFGRLLTRQGEYRVSKALDPVPACCLDHRGRDRPRP